MNYLSVNCSVEKGLGRVVIVILNEENDVFGFTFKSPSVFSFKKNSAEILNWHKDNIISIISQFNIEGVAVKKTERTAFFSKPKNSDIFKLYLEGVLLSLAGSIGKCNKHFYKTDIQTILKDINAFGNSIDLICEKYSLNNAFDKIPSSEIEATKEALLTVLALKLNLQI